MKAVRETAVTVSMTGGEAAKVAAAIEKVLRAVHVAAEPAKRLHYTSANDEDMLGTLAGALRNAQELS